MSDWKKQMPNVAMYPSQLGAVHHNLAMLDLQQSNITSAVKRLEKAVEYQEKALAMQPNDQRDLVFMSQHLQSLKQIALDTFNPELLAKATKVSKIWPCVRREQKNWKLACRT